MGIIKKGKERIGIESTIGTAKDKLCHDEVALSELKGAVESTDWKERCTLLFELICQHFDGRKTAEELISHEVINYVAVEVLEDFKEVFQAIQAKYPSMDLNSSVHGYLIHVQNLIKEEKDFEYPDEILYIAGTMIIGKFKGFMK
jgi:hypothetical protein